MLIGGPPGAGKSTLGRGLASRLGFGSLTGDDLLVAARTLTTARSHPAFHYGDGQGHVHYFTEGPGERLVADALAREEAMWPVLKRVISSHLASGDPVVIDWWLLRPTTVAALEDERIHSFWLYIDPGALWDRERKNTGWMEGSVDPDRMLDHFMFRSLWRNELVAEEAEDLGLPTLRLSGGEPVDAIVQRVLEYLEG